MPGEHYTPLASKMRYRVITDKDVGVSFTEQQFYDDPSPYVTAIGAPFALVHRATAYDLTEPDFSGTVDRMDLPADEFITPEEIRVTDFNGYSYGLALGEPGEWAGEPIGRFVPLAHLCSVCGDVAPPGEGRSAQSMDERWPGRWCAYCIRTFKNRMKGKTPTGRQRRAEQCSPHQIHEREGSRTICEAKACSRNSCRYLWTVVDSSAFLIEMKSQRVPMTQGGYCDAHGDMMVEEGRGFDIPPFPHCDLVAIAEKPRMIRYIQGDDFNREAKAIREFAKANTYQPRIDQIDDDGTVPEDLAHALIQASVGATIRDAQGNPVWTTDEGWEEFAERSNQVANVSPEQAEAWAQELHEMREDGFTSEQVEARAQEMILEAWSDYLREVTHGKVNLIDEDDD